MPQDGLFFRVLRRINMIMATIILLLTMSVLAYLFFADTSFPLGLRKLSSASAPAATKPVAAKPTFEPQAQWFPSQDAYPPIAEDKVLYVLKKTTPAAEPAALGEVATPATEDVNIMIIDEKTGEGRWLFEGRNQVIIAREAIYEGDQPQGSTVGTDPRKVLGMVLQVVDDDTNNDGKLDAKDDITLYLWRKDTTGLVKLLTSDDGAGGGPAGNGRYMIYYGKDGKQRVAAYSLPEFTRIYDKELPQAPH